MQYTPEYFDALFIDSDDPWQFKTRWYESRKRALTLASLPAPRYANAFEPGCANGELSVALAARCDRLLVSDASPKAVIVARARVADFPHVQVSQERVPLRWPEEMFDLIVISELAYYLDSEEIDKLAARTRASLASGGTVVACHWRRKIHGCALDGDEVHQQLNDRLALPRLSQVLEPDLRIDVWCHDRRSVAQRDGLA